MKRHLYLFLFLAAFSFSCQPKTEKEKIPASIQLTEAEANRLVKLPLHCLQVEYPNKLNQTLGNESELKGPKALHPTFYGCFDWHSSAHGHWMLVSLMRQFPDLEDAEEIRRKLLENISEENIAVEVAYFEGLFDKGFERTYGWAWILKLAEEIHLWDDPLARELERNLQPMTDLMVEKYLEFLPKLIYPIRVGEHTNIAFGLSLAYDYAKTMDHAGLQELIKSRALDWFSKDENCPLMYEPSGFDFLSPCFQELDIMRKVMSKEEFQLWVKQFLPQLASVDFALEPGKVSDRTDGKLVHLDGLNFSRAWVLYGLIKEYPNEYAQLNQRLGLRQTQFGETLDNSIRVLKETLENDPTLKSQDVNIEVVGRTKELYSLWHKMEMKHDRNLDHISDLVALRVILTPASSAKANDNNNKDEADSGVWLCYHVLGLVQHLPGFQPMPTKVKDYISFPKPNGYQSLHTALMYKGQSVEVQIRTSYMHQVAEYGMASHFAYKDEMKRNGGNSKGELYNTPWLSSIKEWQQDTVCSRDFVDCVRRELLGRRVFVFLRNGKILNLARGATAVDAAFQIHTEVGLRMHGVEINGKPVRLSSSSSSLLLSLCLF